MGDLFETKQAQGWQVAKTYAYRDETGRLLFEVCRTIQKDFFVRKPDGNGGWISNVRGIRRVLYRLPELIAADPSLPVFIVEGEKDADRLASLNLVATTNPGGAGKWRPEFGEALRNRRCVIIPDGDDPGQRHAEEVARALQGVAASVQVLKLDGLPLKGDVSVWLDGGHTKENLLALVGESPASGVSQTTVSSGLGTADKTWPKVSLAECLATVRRWLLLRDDEAVTYLLALLIANRLPGDPVWGFIVAPSGGAKTELLNALSGIPEIYPLTRL
jgi:hypothetical protein